MGVFRNNSKTLSYPLVNIFITCFRAGFNIARIRILLFLMHSTNVALVASVLCNTSWHCSKIFFLNLELKLISIGALETMYVSTICANQDVARDHNQLLRLLSLSLFMSLTYMVYIFSVTGRKLGRNKHVRFKTLLHCL